MKKKSNVGISVLAICLCVVLLFSANAPMTVSVFTNENTGDGNESQTTSAELTTTDDNAVSSVTSALSTESEVSDAFIDAGNTSAEDLPEAEDILPNTSSADITIDEDPEVESEQDGTSIIPIDVNTAIRDILPSETSINTYTFTLSQRGAIAYAFTHVTATDDTCNWVITLYEEYSPDGTGDTTAYREINSVTYTSVGTAVNSPVTGLLPGNYRVSVECYTGYTAEKFEFAVGFVSSEQYETECNDTQSRYTYIPLNKTLTGSASSFRDGTTDVDWYMFKITDEGYTAVYFTHGEDTDTSSASSYSIAWRIQVTDVEGNEYYYTTSSMESASINSGVMGLPEGYYFITVYSHVLSGVTYDLTVSFSSDAYIEHELNETPETATPIDVNTQMIGSLTERYDTSDVDYYSFTMDNDGFIVLEFIHESLSDSNDGWNIQVISDSGQTLYSATSAWDQGSLQSPYIGISAGTYYIKIDSDNIYRNSIVYRLILITTEDGTWETEPNNTPETADTITFGDTINGTMIELGIDYDKDYYEFELTQSGVITVTFSHIISDDSGKTGWTVYLLDEDLNTVRTITSDWSDSQKSFIYKTEETGKYYILVETGLYFNSNRYALSLSRN